MAPLFLAVLPVHPPGHEYKGHATLPCVLREVLFAQKSVGEHRFALLHEPDHAFAQNVAELGVRLLVELREVMY